MTWITASLLMFASSVVYYLVIKLSVDNKVSRDSSMLANFFIAGIFYLIFNIINHYSLFVPIWIIVWIFFAALILSYISSAISYEAIKIAPNAGYSLIIQKSYAIYTTIAAIFLFNSTFSIKKFIAIIIIIICTAAISIDKSKKFNRNNYLWVILSILSFFGFGTLSLSNKFIVNQGIPSTVLLFWTMMFVSLFSLISLLFVKKPIKEEFNSKKLIILFFTGFTVTFFYYFKQIAEISAPNIGYVNAINTASNAFYTVLVALIFKDHLSWKKFLAVAGVTAGIILLVI